MTEDRDWLFVLRSQCDECGLDAASLDHDALVRRISEEGREWQSLVRRFREEPGADPSAQPAPDAWSAWQYAGHVRDVLDVFTTRVERARREDGPALGWWDHEESALHYHDEPLDQIARELRHNADRFATSLGTLEPDEWMRTSTRREHERFTILDMARFTLHETHHHRLDAARAAERTAPS